MNKIKDPQLSECLEKAILLKQENLIWFDYIKNVDRDVFFHYLEDTHTKVFKNTDCLACANCCRTTPALLTQQDVKRLAKHLTISPKQFIRTYVLTDISGEMILNSVPCKFLNEDNSCQVYEIRPEACRRYPHTNERDYPVRKSLNIANTLICPAAFKVTEILKKSFPVS